MGSEGENEETRALAVAAAGWWGDILREGRMPSLLSDAGHGTGGNLLGGAFGDAMMAEIRKGQPETTEEQIVAFEEALAANLVAFIERGGLGCFWVDYGPDRPLAEALKAAGIERADLPFKTLMWVRDGEIEVQRGYRAEHEHLCETKLGALQRCLCKLHSASYPGGMGIPYDHPSKVRWSALNDRTYAIWKRVPDGFEGDIEERAAAILAEATAAVDMDKTTEAA